MYIIVDYLAKSYLME